MRKRNDNDPAQITPPYWSPRSRARPHPRPSRVAHTASLRSIAEKVFIGGELAKNFKSCLHGLFRNKVGTTNLFGRACRIVMFPRF